ncbi:hypothetical protein [Amycolatopsis anabasis]|nr:hypothetical protein [Amycolatopsis anabasis]
MDTAADWAEARLPGLVDEVVTTILKEVDCYRAEELLKLLAAC